MLSTILTTLPQAASLPAAPLSAVGLPAVLRPLAEGEDAVTGALNAGRLLLAIAIGVVAGAALAFLVSMLLKAAFARSKMLSAMLGRMRGPAYWALMAWGAWAGQSVLLSDTDLSQLANGALVAVLKKVLLVLAISATTWVVFAATWIVEDAARLRHTADLGRSRRYETQAQVLRRVLQAIVVILGVGWAVFTTFPEAKQVLSAVLASAGVLSVVAGLAAQSTLGNVFAGIQLAFTDAIRVGDVVVAGPDGDSGAIEEITLTYVVVRVWDERRLIMPSTYFTSQPFQNWTRRAAKQLGTVELTLDWGAPMAQIRARVEQLLLASDLWDGRTWNVQMTDSDRDSVTVRVLVSAKDSGDLWDLRCYLRENLVSWLADEEAWTRPVTRVQQQQTVTVEHDESHELVARLAAELSGIAGGAADTGAPGADASPGPSGPASADPAPAGSHADEGVPAGRIETPLDAFHAARLQAARRRAKRARRRAMAERQRASAEGRSAGGAPAGSAGGDAPTPSVSETLPASGGPDDDRTRLFTQTELLAIAQRYAAKGEQQGERRADRDQDRAPVREAAPSPQADPAPAAMTVTTTGGRGERLYSGSPDAEERRSVFAGPGEDALAEREEAARLRAAQKGPVPDAVAKDGGPADPREPGDGRQGGRDDGEGAPDRTRLLPAVQPGPADEDDPPGPSRPPRG
jgi:small-conductance mechanosensitive channel